MPGRISMSLTKRQFCDGSKTVTRRNGWQHLKAGDELIVVEKAMGLKKGQKHVLLGRILVKDARRERLARMTDNPLYGSLECIYEGFPDLTPEQFIEMFCKSHSKCKPSTVITRIEFKKLEVADG